MSASPWNVGLTVVGSLAVGLAIGSSWPSESAPVADEATLGSEQQDRVALALVTELRGIREVLERLEAVGPATRSIEVPVGEEGATANAPSDSWVAALGTRLGALEEKLAASATAAAEPRAAPPIRLPSESFEPAPLPSHADVSTREFSKRHYFWSMQQVVDAYGLPEEMTINPHGEHIWGYEHGGETLEFVLHDGYVARVEW